MDEHMYRCSSILHGTELKLSGSIQWVGGMKENMGVVTEDGVCGFGEPETESKKTKKKWGTEVHERERRGLVGGWGLPVKMRGVRGGVRR